MQVSIEASMPRVHHAANEAGGRAARRAARQSPITAAVRGVTISRMNPTKAALAVIATTAILLLGVTPTAGQNQSARKLYVFQAKVAQAERQCWTVGGFVRCVDGSDDDEIGLYVVRDILSKCPSTITITNSKQDAELQYSNINLIRLGEEGLNSLHTRPCIVFPHTDGRFGYR